MLAEDYRSATFTITAKEETNGISKIEVLQNGQVVQKFDYSNVTDTINEPVTVKRNGTYTVKVYSNLTGTARTEVLGIVMSVEFSPNGEKTYKKEHSTKITDFTPVKLSDNGITLNVTAEDLESGIAKIEYYVDGVIQEGYTETITEPTKNITRSINITGLSMREHDCKVVIKDSLQHANKNEKKGTTMMYTWECYNMVITHAYKLGSWKLVSSTGLISSICESSWSIGTCGCDPNTGHAWSKGDADLVEPNYQGYGFEFWNTTNNSSSNPLEHYVEKIRIVDCDERFKNQNGQYGWDKQAYEYYRAYVEDLPSVSVGDLLKLVTSNERDTFPDEGELETDVVEGELKQYHFVWKGIE